MSRGESICMQWAVRIAIAQAIILISFSSWALGGRYPGSAFYIGLIAWLGLIPIAMYWYDLGWYGFGKWLARLSPWLILLVLLFIGLQNPLYERHAGENAAYITWEKTEPVAGLPICYNPERTQEYLWIFSGGLITATSVFTVIRKKKQIIVLLALVATNGLLHAVIGSWFKLTHNPNVLGIFEPVNIKFFSSFRYYNHWVAFGLLSLGSAVTVADYLIQRYNRSGWNDRGRSRWDLVWVAIAAMIWIAIPLSGSRSGMIFSAIFIVGSSIYLAIAFRRRTSIFKHLDRHTRRILGIGLLSFLAVFSVIGFALAWDTVMNRLDQTTSDMEAGRVDQRFYASPRDCWKMINDRPVWGWGIGSYAYTFYLYAGPEYRHPLGRIIKRNEYAHNDWMQYWVELGTVGYILFLSVPIGVIVQTFRRPRENSECFWLALCTGLFLTFASFDFPFGPSAGIAIFAVCFAAGARLSLGPGKRFDIEEYYANRP